MNYYGLKISNNKCICPFHNDTNPSLSVSPKKNIATCFSCKVAGNPISFVKNYETLVNHRNITDGEVIEIVAKACNLNVDVSKLKRKGFNSKYFVAARKYTEAEQKLLEVNENLNKLFNYNLTVNKSAKEYLHNRDIDDDAIKDANLGFAQKGQLLKAKDNNEKYPLSALIELGYLKENDYGNLYEVFSDRIMIPIRDEKGNIVTFCGRTIKDEEPKYLHTAETKIFKKKELLYNFSSASPLAYNNEIILVEGYMDVLGAKKLGYNNVAAIMGTALTPEQINLIKKNHSYITLALDNDRAGRESMLQYIPELLKQDFKINVIDISKLGDYKDFGVLAENNIPFMEIQKVKITGFTFLLDHKYFKDLNLDVDNIRSVYKELKRDKIINNTYDEFLYKEYVENNSSFTRRDIEEIIYPKKIEQKENLIDNFAAKAMSSFLYTELLLQIEKQDDEVLKNYFTHYKEKVEEKIISIFNDNPEVYVDYSSSKVKTDLLLNEILKDNKEYLDYESLNRFKYVDVFTKTYIKNSNGQARLKLNEEQRQMVIKQFEESLSDESKLALEEVEELYIINSLDDIDGILDYNSSTLEVLKDNLKDRMFLNKDKMDFFKFGSLFLKENKDFIDNKFKGRTGNFKTILFYNNLNNNLNVEKNNVISDKEVIDIKEFHPIKRNNTIEKVINRDYDYSINKVLIVPEFERDDAYFIRIPGTAAKEYFYLPKSECKWSETGEMLYSTLHYGETYSIYNSEGEYISTKTFDELKINWEDKTKKEVLEEGHSKTEKKEDDFTYDNNYTSKYKEPIIKVYHSKKYLETDKGFYIRTEDPNVLLFAIKKICNWTEDGSYLIITPRKKGFNSGISKYHLTGFKKDFEKRLGFSEIEKYINIIHPKNTKNKSMITIEFSKDKCSFSSNYIQIPMVIDDIKGYIQVNLIKSKITQDKVVLELSENEQVEFHKESGEYLNSYNSKKIYNIYNEQKAESKIIKFPTVHNVVYEVPEKEAA